MPPATKTTFHQAGWLYLAIIVLGLGSELVVRAPLSALPADVAAARIEAGAFLFRLSIAADGLMVAADVTLAVLLYRILAPAGQSLAVLATLFRLIQAAVIAANLLNQFDALLWALGGDAEAAIHALRLHGIGYDIGLIFFGINSLLTGLLLVRSAHFQAWLGRLVQAAGAVYLTGSALVLLAPVAAEAFQPAYLIAVLAEAAFTVALLRHRRAEDAPVRTSAPGSKAAGLPSQKPG